MPFRSRSLVALIILMSVVRPLTASEDPQRTFTKRWEGKRVVVKQSLFTLVYDERNRIGHYSRKRDGLIVVGLSGAHLQFNGRDSESDIIEQDPDRLADVVRNTYVRSLDLDIGCTARSSQSSCSATTGALRSSCETSAWRRRLSRCCSPTRTACEAKLPRP